MTSTDAPTAARRTPLAAALGWLRGLCAELWTLAPDPLPRLGGHRLFAWLPHAAIAALAVLTFERHVDELVDAYGLPSDLGNTMALLLSGSLVLALLRPVPAWWLATATTVLTARLAETTVEMSAAYPWTAEGFVLQGAVVFLLALRVRPRAAITAASISAAAGLVCAQLTTGPHRYDTDEALLVLAAAVVLGMALRVSRNARAQLVEQQVLTAEERAQRTLLEERNRIARELHDVVAHHMSVISIQAQVAPHLVEDPPTELTDNLSGIRDNAVAALTELRRVLGVLRAETAAPAPHSPQPSLEQLEELIDNVRSAGLVVSTRIRGDRRPLSPGVELSAYRIVQEALSNSIRHAPGATVAVELHYLPDGVTVRVANSAPPAAAPPPRVDGYGHGLLGMRERTAMLGGELTSGATGDGGFAVFARLPVTVSAPAAAPVEDAQ